jgi:hypothetical protein
MKSVLREDRTWDGERETGLENSRTTEVAVRKELDAEAAPELQDSNRVLGTGGVDVGTGTSVGVGVDTVDKV